MKVGILLPSAETDSGAILRYGAIRDAALQAERGGLSVEDGIDSSP